MNGLKNHQIAQLVNAITTHLNDCIPGLPQMTREIVSVAAVDYLEGYGLMVDRCHCGDATKMVPD